MPNHCYLCNSRDLKFVYKINKKPELEVFYNNEISNSERNIYQCNKCKVFNNFHNAHLEEYYLGEYNVKHHVNINNNFQKIIDLPFEKSDNKQRVKRIIDFLSGYFQTFHKISLLDVGSGLGVFPYEILKYGLEVTGLDPDNNSVVNMKNQGIKNTINNYFQNLNLSQFYDVITFNKILEHVKFPVRLLQKAYSMLNQNGIVYIEVPDGDNAMDNDVIINRQEFFIDHHLIFNKQSVTYILIETGFIHSDINCIYEPSGKYSVYGFGVKK